MTQHCLNLLISYLVACSKAGYDQNCFSPEKQIIIKRGGAAGVTSAFPSIGLALSIVRGETPCHILHSLLAIAQPSCSTAFALDGTERGQCGFTRRHGIEIERVQFRIRPGRNVSAEVTMS